MKQKILWMLLLFAFILPLAISLRTIISGNIPFWYDPGRDLLLAWDNLKKPTLIGPPSGIPGLFYGPYWIWLLSIGMLFSKDPRVIVFLTQTVPYFTILPFILWKFSKMLGKRVILSYWILFMLHAGIGYASMIWSPHMASLLFLILIYILVYTDYKKTTLQSSVKTFLAGIISGILINFHISFGLAILLGTIFFFIINTVRSAMATEKHRKSILFKNISTLMLFIFGVLLAFSPFLLFEYRHGFNQTQTVLHALSKYGAVVGIKGINKQEVIQQFFGRLGSILGINWTWGYILEVLGAIVFLKVFIQKQLKLQENEKKLILLLISTSLAVLTIYLTARNPVWGYHFIGTEVIFLFFISLFAKKIPLLKKLLTLWVIFVVVTSLPNEIKAFNTKPNSYLDLQLKEQITDIVAKDAENIPYTVFIYNPAIYTYDYTYLFKWRHHKDFSFDPGDISKDNPTVYLIIPKVYETYEDDLVNYRTPNTLYQTAKTWKLTDETKILKRTMVKK